MPKKLFLVGVTSLLLAACGGDNDSGGGGSSSSSSSGSTPATDGVYSGTFTWRFNNNNRAPGSVTFTFTDNMVVVRRGSITGNATFTSPNYTVTENTPTCAWVYTGTVGNGTTTGTISAVRCSGTLTGSYTANR